MTKHKKASTTAEAWQMQELYSGKPHGWIQWKATDVTMSIRCKCGHDSLIQADFAYHVRCPKCRTVYMCNGHIELIELEKEPPGCIVTGEADDE